MGGRARGPGARGSPHGVPRVAPEQHGELADGPEVRLRIEGFYLRFVVWLVHVRRVQVETARKYFGEALSAHTSFYGPPVPSLSAGLSAGLPASTPHA